ncbi:hypothetical protein LAZ67_10003810 [Cordylochernes scorpioides]|uniref:Mariner Mos1 transposase n=1 Tax=Cordylochernes scorpioides TaxID=51811 RepID=A0ABY6L0N4_9ARAC|nr:hypothetical protein LAZ67_10003810 [Cordylochernes scorpioides]
MGNIERHICPCELLLKRPNRKGFLHRIVTGDEKWIHYDNPKRRKSWVKPGHASTSSAKPNIHGKKLMLCIWWDQLEVIYYELLQPNETITGERYQQQLMRLSRALKIKRPLYAKRHDKVIYQHDNARPHVAKVVKETLEALQWDVLPHPLYSPDIAPSDYQMFRSMTHGLAEQHFTSYEEAKNWVNVWIASKDEEFFRHGIPYVPPNKRVEREKKIFKIFLSFQNSKSQIPLGKTIPKGRSRVKNAEAPIGASSAPYQAPPPVARTQNDYAKRSHAMSGPMSDHPAEEVSTPPPSDEALSEDEAPLVLTKETSSEEKICKSSSKLISFSVASLLEDDRSPRTSEVSQGPGVRFSVEGLLGQHDGALLRLSPSSLMAPSPWSPTPWLPLSRTLSSPHIHVVQAMIIMSYCLNPDIHVKKYDFFKFCP